MFFNDNKFERIDEVKVMPLNMAHLAYFAGAIRRKPLKI